MNSSKQTKMKLPDKQTIQLKITTVINKKKTDLNTPLTLNVFISNNIRAFKP